jgi:drug/metabolite transporter (DMT)-like permease
MSTQAWLLLFGLGFVWGGTFYFTEVLLLSMTPFHIVFFRVGIAALVMLAYIHFRGKRLPLDPASLRQFAIMGFFNNALPFSCIVFGQQYITAGLASILNSFTAFVTVMAAGMLMKDELITTPRMVGTILGVIGVAVTMGIDHLSSLSLASVGQILILIATASYAIASMYGRLRVNNHGIEVSATGMLISSTLWMLIISLLVEGVPVIAQDTSSILALLAIAIPCTSLAYLLYFALLKLAGASNTMLVTIIIPVFALVIDAFILGEVISIREMTGFLIIAIGLLILSGKIPIMKNPG